MSDQQAMPQQSLQPQAMPQQQMQPQGSMPGRMPAGAPKKSIVSKLATAVSTHAYMSLAVIIVLLILVIGLYVYYHGLLFLGPFASTSKKAGFKGKKKKSKDDDDDSDDVKGDPETEKLIQSINQQ